MTQWYEPRWSELAKSPPGRVSALTPLRRGFDDRKLFDALVTLIKSLAGEEPELLIAAHPDDEQLVRDTLDDVSEESGGELDSVRVFTTTSENVAATRNRLLSAAETRYVVQADGDDLWVPGALATLKWQLDRNPELAAAHGKHLEVSADASVVTFQPPDWWYQFPGDVARPGELAEKRREKGRAQAAWHRREDYVAAYPAHPGAGLFRRTAVVEAGGWDEACGNYFEDTVLLAKIQHRHSMYVCGNPTMLYRTGQPGSLSRRPVNGEGWKVLERIILAHEVGQPDLAPPPPFEAPPAAELSLSRR